MKQSVCCWIFIFCVSCTPHNGIVKNELKSQKALEFEKETPSKHCHLTVNSISQVKKLYNDTCYIDWYGGTLLTFTIENNIAYFGFSASDGASFKIKQKEDKIIFYWSYNAATGFFKKFFNQSFGIKTFPKEGKPFGEFTLASDTSLSVKYYYKEWVNAINMKSSEIYFPSLLIIRGKK